MEPIQPVSIQHPQGFLSLAKNVGIRDATLDLTVIYSTKPARAAAMFTRSRFPGAPVIVRRKPIPSVEGLRNVQRLRKTRNPKIDSLTARKLHESGFIDRAFAAQGVRP